ncbi:MAG: MscL family protein [Patescibacteria group bacterium]
MRGFIDFLRGQGVVGFATGFILGGAVSALVTSFITNIVNPLLSVILGAAKNLEQYSLHAGPIEVFWGKFIAALINFLILAAVVYYGFKILGLDRLDKKRD